MIFCCVIRGILPPPFVSPAFEKLRDQRRHSPLLHRRHHLIELGKEREMFFIPGDRKDEEYEESDDE